MKQTMVIVGLGLIGGSLALALKGFEDFEIVGVDVSQPTLRYAAEHGVGDRVTEDAAAELPQADVDGFVALVDELGGIEFDVPVRLSFDDPTQDLHIHYQPGLQHLTGEDVLKVARCRNNSDGPGSYPDNLYGAYPDGDIGRTRTQQQLIAAILKKALSNPQKINSYVNLFLEYVDTDLEFSEALWFAQPALGLDFSTGFASATLAGENVYYVDSRGYRWGSCYELDPEAALETVNSLINPYNAPLTAADLNIFQKP